MADSSCRECTQLKDGFSIGEKTLARLLLLVWVLVGAAAINRTDPAWALAYVLFVAAGGLLLIYAFLCVSCPYPFEYRDCLFFPHELVTRVIRRRRAPYAGWQKVGMGVILAGIVVWPQYWLIADLRYLFTFWGLTLAVGLVFDLYFCTRCRHRECLFNRSCEATGTAGLSNED